MTKILAIDYKQDNLITLSAVLKNFLPGCIVITAQSGAEGIKKAREVLPDTILLDIKMPRIDGFEVCERLKSANKTKYIPVIMLTAARTDTKSRIKGLDLGADAFLSKPINEAELVAQVNVMLRIKKAEDVLRKEKDLLEEAVQARTKQLSESEARFRLLYERAPFPYQSLNKNGRFVEINEAWLDTLGYSREEVVGQWFGDFLTPLSADHFKRNFPRFKASGEISGVEFEMMRKGGSCLTVEYTGKIGHDKDGGFKQTHCIFHNITERKQAEKALRESEERYRSLVENIDLGITLIDSEHNIVMANAAQGRSFNKSVSELIGKKCFREFVKRDAVCQDCPGVRAMATGRREEVETEGMRDDGSCFKVRIQAFPTLSLDGAATGFIEVAEDITERKRAEEEQVRLATAIEQAAEIVIIMDTEGMIQYVNPAFEQISGYAREEVVGRNFRILNNDKHDDAFYKMIWDSVTLDEVWGGHIINRKKDGSLYEVEATISSVRDKVGAIINYVALQRDVTHEVELERRLLQAQKLEAIGTLAGGIAHDFNNILAGIMGYTEMVLHQLPNGTKEHEFLHQVLNASARAKDLVKQILAFSRQAGQERRPVQASLIVKEALKLLRASLPSTIELRQHIKAASCTVLADPTQIHQVLMNLCTNAAYATREKGGVLEVSLAEVDIDPGTAAQHPDMKPGPYVRLTVSDTGHGMDSSVMGRIFDPYFTTKEKGEGTGLGLAVVHGIAKSLGGAITVYSEPGKGTTFHVFFPKIETKVTQHIETDAALPRGHERILFVDDEKPLVAMVRQMLEDLGYEVVAKTSSIEALAIFRSQPDKFDLVITDQTMPKMTGVDLAKELLRVRADIPIILSTGFSEAVTPEKAKGMGIREFVMKPMVMRDTAETIRRVLDTCIED